MSYRPPAERWDRARLGYERDRYQDRDARGPYAPRDASVDDVYSRHERSHYDGDRYESRRYDDVERDRVTFSRPGRDRGFTVEKEREREYYAAEPPRPGLLRRQSSLDTFDRRPLKFLDRDREREELGPPARYYGPPRGEEFRPGPPPLTPVRRALMPAAPGRHYERDYYDDEFPQQIREREREIIRRRRHSKESKHSRRSHSKESRSTHSTRSSSSSSSSASGTTISIKSEFPKKGKTRMPARLVSTKAIIDLGYPFEADGDVIIIQRALGRENIDEVIKLSEDYIKAERASMSGARMDGGTMVEERRTTEVYQVPASLPPPPVGFVPPPPPPGFAGAPGSVHFAQPPPSGYIPPPQPPAPVQNVTEKSVSIKETKFIESERSPSPAPSHHSSYHHHSHHSTHNSHAKSGTGPIILEGRPRDESTLVEHRTITERSAAMPVGPLALAVPSQRHRVNSGGEVSIRERIKYLELEKKALEAERRVERARKHHRKTTGTEVVIYDKEVDRFTESGYGERDVTVVKRETKLVEPEGGVRIEKDRKGRMSISVPRYS